MKTDGYYEEVNLSSSYKSVEEMREDGFLQMNDFCLSALLYPGNVVGVDRQVWNNKNKYYIWDPDWKRWMLAAERRY